MEIKDLTGTPRRDDEVEAALQAVKEKIVRHPLADPAMTIHYITIKDALEELLASRRAAKVPPKGEA